MPALSGASSAKFDTTAQTLGFRYRVAPLSAAYTVLVEDSGTIFTVSQASAYTITLPDPAYDNMGCVYRFVCTTAGANAVVLTTTTGSTVMNGVIATGEDAAGSVARATFEKVNFVASKAEVGDYVEVVSDGTNWQVSGMCGVQDGMTIST